MESLTTILLLAILCGTAGASIPHMAHKIMQKKRAQYQNWFTSSLSSCELFWVDHHRIPCSKAQGIEGSLGIWIRELNRLLTDRAIAREEGMLLVASPLPLGVSENLIANLPSAKIIDQEFSCPHGIVLSLFFAGIAGALSLGASFVFLTSPSLFVFDAMILLCLLISLIDIKCRTIPTELTALFAFGAVLWNATLGWQDFAEAMCVAGAMLALLIGIDRIFMFLYGERGIGGGDKRLLPLAGLLAGFPGIIAGFIASGIFLALTFGVLLCTGHLTAKTKIPFAPFISLTALIGTLYQVSS